MVSAYNMIRADTIIVAARSQTRHNFFTIVINWRYLVVCEMAVPRNALAFTRVNALHFTRPTASAQVVVLSHCGYVPLVPTAGAFNCRHLFSVSKENPRRSGGLSLGCLEPARALCCCGKVRILGGFFFLRCVCKRPEAALVVIGLLFQ